MAIYPDRRGYDDWKTDPGEYIAPDERPEGCDCFRRIGDYEWCPVHGRDPDEERERRRDDSVCG